MKIQIIPDLHCKPFKHLIQEGIDHYVFLGDYLDSFTHTNEEMLTTFQEVVQFKKDDYEKSTLLIGNHELYIFNLTPYPCSGYRKELHDVVYDIYNRNRDCFKVAYQYKNHLFTHAGLTEYVWDKYISLVNKLPIDSFNGSYADWLNLALEKQSLMDILTIVGKKRGGWYPSGGVFWADKYELEKDYLEANIVQYVGHTPVKNITKHKNIWFLDILDKNPNQEIVFDL